MILYKLQLNLPFMFILAAQTANTTMSTEPKGKEQIVLSRLCFTSLLSSLI